MVSTDDEMLTLIMGRIGMMRLELQSSQQMPVELSCIVLSNERKLYDLVLSGRTNKSLQKLLSVTQLL